MSQYDDAEEALTEANFLNNQNPGRQFFTNENKILI
jgi:hypothetical protein